MALSTAVAASRLRFRGGRRRTRRHQASTMVAWQMAKRSGLAVSFGTAVVARSLAEVEPPSRPRDVDAASEALVEEASRGQVSGTEATMMTAAQRKLSMTADAPLAVAPRSRLSRSHRHATGAATAPTLRRPPTSPWPSRSRSRRRPHRRLRAPLRGKEVTRSCRNIGAPPVAGDRAAAMAMATAAARSACRSRSGAPTRQWRSRSRNQRRRPPCRCRWTRASPRPLFAAVAASRSWNPLQSQAASR
mmetsp:Transcript_28869/g.79573  ORF Transcript_28869/g.79573 Transcript_28869/m.79573 type:complete len:247 (-) Transcript_28869:772-1512(-)